MAEQEPDPVLAVLNIPELLEAICLHLPTETIARSRRVSRIWKEVIDNSVKLQQALFLLPAKPELYLNWVKRVNHHDLGNIWQTALLHEASEGSRLVFRTHPTLEPDSTADTYCIDHALLKMIPLNTLLTQPPCRQVVIRHNSSKISMERKSGVTFGAVVEKLGDLECRARMSERLTGGSEWFVLLLPSNESNDDVIMESCFTAESNTPASDDFDEYDDISKRQVSFEFPGLITNHTTYVQSAIQGRGARERVPRAPKADAVGDDQDGWLIPQWLV